VCGDVAAYTQPHHRKTMGTTCQNIYISFQTQFQLTTATMEDEISKST